jgi:tRNA pseudouridine38-40 synthase
VGTFKVTLAYDGTEYVGWQRQASGVSIQGTIEEALMELEGAAVTVSGAGRTDAGVHAAGQVASFSIRRTIGPDALARALNAGLPPDVRVLKAEEVPDSFHARFQARVKTYRYRIFNGAVLSPFERRFAWQVAGPLDVEAMASAARAIEGRYDFAAFQGAGSDTGSTVRDVARSRLASAGLDIELREGPGAMRPLVVYEIQGNGFLRFMVRNIVGTLVEIGRGRRAPESIAGVLASRDRRQAGPTAPAAGLVLMSVDYDEVRGFAASS